MKIYVVTHKIFNKPPDSIYCPIVAGAFEHNEEFPYDYIRDDTMNNISCKHDLYSEFTAIYWMWKNSNDNIIGENHYRRFFIKGSWLSYALCEILPISFVYSKILKENDINKIFEAGYNCILPKKQAHMRYSLFDHYCLYHDGHIFDYVKNIILEKYPEYIEDFEETLNLRCNYQKCIFIMKKELFDDFASWIFDIFTELETMGRLWGKREFAFLGERLVNVWILHNVKNDRLKIKELFYVNSELRFFSKPFNKDDLIFPTWLEKYNYLRHRITK